MFNVDKLVVNILTEDYAKEICKWRYDSEYSVYNFSDWETVVKNKWGLSIKNIREKEFIAFLYDSEIIGYGRIHLNNDKIYIGIGLKPVLCGNGYGKYIMKILIEESKRRYLNKTISLEVRSFNERALKCYQKVGFEIKGEYTKETLLGSSRFIYMEYIAQEEDHNF